MRHPRRTIATMDDSLDPTSALRRWIRTSIVLFVAAAGTVTACGDDDPSDDSQLPNPAAAYCESLGGTTSGPEPMCRLPDGRTVDAWELYRTEVLDSSTTTSTTSTSTTTANTTDTSGSATTTGPTSSATGPTTAPVVDVHEVRVYLLGDEIVAPVARTVDGDGVGLGAIRQLVSGPTAAERARGLSSAIPDGTEVLGLAIDGSTAVIDLSDEFTTGGGTASMMGRVAQVVFTLTQFDNVDDVEFQVDGVPLESLGGEGLMLDEPQDRDDWEALSPAILIEAPLPDSEVSSTVRVIGTANTFEAGFRLSVVDATGAVVYDEAVQATSGTGTRGTFDVTIQLPDSATGPIELIGYEPSAMDGSPINVVTVPITIS